MRIYSLLSFLIIQALLLALLGGCAGQRGPKGPPPREYLEHRISFEGETLALIAKWYTGRAENWKAILAHNPGLDVYRMRKGMLVQIPKDMIVSDGPMPAAYVQRYYTRMQEQALLEGASGQPADGTQPGGAQAGQGLGPLHSGQEQQGGSDAAAAASSLGPPEKALPGSGTVSSGIDIGDRVLPDESWVKDAAQKPSGSPAEGGSGRVENRDQLLKEILNDKQ